MPSSMAHSSEGRIASVTMLVRWWPKYSQALYSHPHSLLGRKGGLSDEGHREHRLHARGSTNVLWPARRPAHAGCGHGRDGTANAGRDGPLLAGGSDEELDVSRSSEPRAVPGRF